MKDRKNKIFVGYVIWRNKTKNTSKNDNLMELCNDTKNEMMRNKVGYDREEEDAAIK